LHRLLATDGLFRPSIHRSVGIVVGSRACFIVNSFYSIAIALNKERHPNPTKYRAMTVKLPLLNRLNQYLHVLI